MKKNFNLAGLDWEDKGYFGCPDYATVSADEMLDPWNQWLVVFHEAKRGNFGHMPALTEMLQKSEDWLLVTTCSDLLGDAGPDSCFDLLLTDLKQEQEFIRAKEICRALYLRGKLSDISMLVSVYAKFSDVKDADIIPVWIADLLEAGEEGHLSEPSHFEDSEDYTKAVLDACKRLADRLGSDQVYIFNGELFGVTSLAKNIIAAAVQPFTRSILRQKFEASTGIDCTNFYKRGELKPQAAAKIVQDFLESPAAAQYKEGVRYFFGHPIPVSLESINN